MKHIFLTAILLSTTMLGACSADHEKKSGWLLGVVPPKEWPQRHWVGQNYSTHIENQDEVLPAALDKNESMFTVENTADLTPDQFVSNLKSSNIIADVYNNREPFLEGYEKTSDIVVELDHNFYTLSRADKVVIADLLYRSYESPVILLKDTETRKTVGTITDGTLQFY